MSQSEGPVTDVPVAVADPAPVGGRGMAILVIALARFIVVLDGTIMTVALPTIQRSLDISQANLDWVISAYSLTFGGLMLLAGRLGDVYGRKLMFRIGVVLFGLASLGGGLAGNGTTLILFRGLEGIGAAIATPGALSLLVSTFPEGQQRTKAFGLYGAATAMGAVMGLLAGGVLTTYAGWRWVLFVNIPIVIVILLGVNKLVDLDTRRSRIDVWGALTVTLGIGALIYGINRVGLHGWSDPTVIGCMIATVVLLAVFVYFERSGDLPMIPREVLSDPGRVGANIVTLVMSIGIFSSYYFLTLYMQQVLGYSAVRTGLMYLPFAVGAGLAAGSVGPQLLARTAPQIALSSGLVLASAGTVWFCFITPDSGVFEVLIPASVVSGVGVGIMQVVSTAIGVRGIDSSEAGIGSALLTAGGQVGGALGVALLGTVAATTTHHAAAGTSPADALTNGYVAGFKVAVGLYLLCVVITFLTIRPVKEGQQQMPQPQKA
ncbi:MFS transporter [Streptomyces sp. NRRL F-5123]|uniref:MFS transporter n=1 Tax=Streptomyces sp. NRRL F-5123 TaxID=1463856 RepID=UPI0007C4501E|nr:MFS transporter [Streptomyces sp. NRRL F-5123]